MRRRAGVIRLVLLVAVSSLILAGCSPYKGAWLWFEISPSVVYYNEPTTIRFSLEERGGLLSI